MSTQRLMDKQKYVQTVEYYSTLEREILTCSSTGEP